MSEVAADMQKQVSTHAEELQNFSNQLLMQKELATKYSVKVLEVEQESRLKALTLKEAHKELSTEKAVSSKFYDEVHEVVHKTPSSCTEGFGGGRQNQNADMCVVRTWAEHPIWTCPQYQYQSLNLLHQ